MKIWRTKGLRNICVHEESKTVQRVGNVGLVSDSCEVPFLWGSLLSLKLISCNLQPTSPVDCNRPTWLNLDATLQLLTKRVHFSYICRSCSQEDGGGEWCAHRELSQYFVLGEGAKQKVFFKRLSGFPADRVTEDPGSMLTTHRAWCPSGRHFKPAASNGHLCCWRSSLWSKGFNLSEMTFEVKSPSCVELERMRDCFSHARSPLGGCSRKEMIEAAKCICSSSS